jgi:hypothetical protein
MEQHPLSNNDSNTRRRSYMHRNTQHLLSPKLYAPAPLICRGLWLDGRNASKSTGSSSSGAERVNLSGCPPGRPGGTDERAAFALAAQNWAPAPSLGSQDARSTSEKKNLAQHSRTAADQANLRPNDAFGSYIHRCYCCRGPLRYSRRCG